MAGAIIRGCLAARVLPPDAIVVCEPDAAKHAAFAVLGVPATASHADALTSLATDGQVLLAVKPQVFPQLAEQVRACWPPRSVVVITILAGTPTPKVRAALGPQVRVVRAMPNLPAAILAGATALCLGDGAKPGDDALAAAVFGGIGPVVARIDEHLMDAFTAVAGSGPAYLFYLAEAMTEAATRLGFDPATADRIVRQTLLGSAALLAQSSDTPATLRAAVTSRKGTTDAAITHMESRQVRDAIIEALEKARNRGRELASS
jgi:pyrroline-5-carboxylate reductase